MKFQNCHLIFVMDAQTDGRTDGQAESNMPIFFFQGLGHKNVSLRVNFCPLPQKIFWTLPRDLDCKANHVKYVLHYFIFVPTC